MVTGKLTEADPFEVAPPRSASERPSNSRDMLVLVGADGRLAVDGRSIESARLRSVVVDHLSTNDGVIVRLKADSEARATQVIAVMELLREAGIEELKLLIVLKSD